ncbi:hypothetical protein ISU88_19210, partial [Leptospira interrogans serovar Pomona]|nr:hypothetical protein [Leptospira interrogans serovar Pomona]
MISNQKKHTTKVMFILFFLSFLFESEILFSQATPTNSGSVITMEPKSTTEEKSDNFDFVSPMKKNGISAEYNRNMF